MSRIKPSVSLYSLQNEYLTHKMSLRDIMYFVKSLGAEGIEILPDQMLKGAPDLSEETVKEFRGLVEETGLKPVCADVFLNMNLYKNRLLTHRECIDLLIKEIEMADRLGIRLIRLVSMVPYWVIEPLIPYCEKHDVTIALEVHAAMAFDIPETKAFVEEMKRVNSPYVGLVIDTGLFCRKFPRIITAYESLFGISKDVFAFIDTLFEKGTDLHAYLNSTNREYPEELKSVIKSPRDEMFIPLCDGYENLDYSVLDEYLPYIKHFHFKLFEMTDEGVEYSMDYKGILEYLHSHNYDGYVSTEYEGNRFTLPGTPFAEKEQVAAHQAYIQKCLKELG